MAGLALTTTRPPKLRFGAGWRKTEEAETAAPLPLRRIAADIALGRRPDERLTTFLRTKDIAVALRDWFGSDISGLKDSNALLGAIERDIAFLDEMLTVQLNAVLHNRKFQRLEASWRGMAYLCDCAAQAPSVLVRALNISWHEMATDFERALDFDQSHLFQKVYSNEFGMPGGVPFGVLLCDYEVRHRLTPHHPVDDVATLIGLSGVAAAAFAPAILGVSPKLLGIDSFRDLAYVTSLSGLFRSEEYARYNRLRSTADSRFLGLVLPRVLMRAPYSADGMHGLPFRYREDLRGLAHEDHCWGSAVYAFGEVLVRGFQAHGWFADICGTRRDEIDHGLVTRLSAPSAETDAPGLVARFASELAIPKNVEYDLWRLGLITLGVCKDTSYLAFDTSVSVQAVATYQSAIATMNARISSMLRYILCVSRIAHYVKVRIRDRVGAYVTEEACERDLQSWLHGYCLGNDDASAEMKARFPLREATAEVRAIPGRPGSFSCVLHLRPHFQIDQIFTTFKLVTDLSLVTARSATPNR
ncbi:type VI secretion system contractile sheath large subunit [Aquabacter spiritensis]|uniref:Type VI secretion system protein ImpD n=1 Tax=Aquabacter spiritensis TaxID=933073 RepID=A0A4R3LQE8_9HYPH|nr:type VI secretion system contractile sheath large subunit [Aquabacter spiritensis]TCT02461.1 type VI secretion system protein ImpD [Aquabacter spiritensis]